MHAITGEYRDGQVFLSGKADWPEHTKVRVEPVEETIGMREEDWSDTPEAIVEWIAWYDSLEPWLSPEDEAKWLAALQEQKDYDKAKFEEEAQKLERLFE